MIQFRIRFRRLFSFTFLPVVGSLLALSPRVFAAEGFSTSLLPPPLQAVSDATIIYRPGSGLCSAFLVAKEEIQGRHILFFMSAAHCLEGIAGFNENAPTTDQNLLGSTISRLFSNVTIDMSRPDWPLHVQGIPLGAKLTPVWAHKHSKFDHSAGPWEDLLVLAFEAEGDTLRLNPVRMGTSGGYHNLTGVRHTVIGFPATLLRPPPLQDVKIDQFQLVEKRWSWGEFLPTREFEIPRFNYANIIASNADGFPGMSGGPVALASGEVVGLVSHGLDRDLVANQVDYSYGGIKNKKPYRMLMYVPYSLSAVRDRVIQMFRASWQGSR